MYFSATVCLYRDCKEKRDNMNVVLYSTHDLSAKLGELGIDGFRYSGPALHCGRGRESGVCVCACVRVCAHVREIEIERERERERALQDSTHHHTSSVIKD